ncbi:hypothetical protein EVAR_2791_1 [Eumeta japonica]|uniref:Uncharacterized protein n=1 Tax=Eumeta variegata TaxID=151549 RepID=A0A4C1T0I7_EUMVA|nr:hypothetical protein EVAR_2791_1 [Eumeta japonica]
MVSVSTASVMRSSPADRQSVALEYERQPPVCDAKSRQMERQFLQCCRVRGVQLRLQQDLHRDQEPHRQTKVECECAICRSVVPINPRQSPGNDVSISTL